MVALPGFLIDVRFSARGFLRRPGLLLTLLFTIALGIGSNASVAGFVRASTTPVSPLAFGDRIVSVFRRDPLRTPGPLSYEDYLSLRSRVDLFEWIGAARVSTATITLAGQSQIVTIAEVTPYLAGLLNLPLNQGAVISGGLRRSEFREKAEVRGESIRIGDFNAHVSSAAPNGLEGVYRDRAVDLWWLLDEKAIAISGRSKRDIWVLGRLRSGVSSNQAQASVRATGEFDDISVLPYTGMMPKTAEDNARVGTLLRLASGLVFFIACGNVASFLLGYAATRSHETSVRVALGAGRGQLARALLADSIVVSVAGGLFGTLLAIWTTHIFPVLLFEEDAERLAFATDVFNIVAASAACVGIIIVCGLLPMFAISHGHPETFLRGESSGPSKGTRRLREALAVTQMTSCCVLVIATAFLLDGFRVALQTTVGRYSSEPILATATADPVCGLNYFRDIEHAARLVAGVSAMGWVARLPGDRPIWRSFRIEPPQKPVRNVTLDIDTFTRDSLPFVILPPIAGRLFGVPDQTCRGAVTNEEAAGALFGAHTVGRAIRDPTGLPVEIIGVIRMRRGADAAGTRPAIYYYNADQTRPHPTALALFRVPMAKDLEQVELDSNVVSASYFAAMGLSPVAGRLFADSSIPHGCRVGVINREAADAYFNGDAVGAAIIDDIGRRTEIIGVVDSAQMGSFQRQPEPAIYFPMEQDCLPRMTMILGARKVDDRLLHELRSAIESVPGRDGFPHIQTLDTHLRQTALAPLRIATVIIGTSATTALVLSVLGLLGALSDAARQRRREIAVRIALGARRRHVIFQVLREGARLAGAAALAGTLGSLLLSPVLAGVTQSNRWPALWVWLAAPFALLAAVALAGALPAKRALSVNPVTIMRGDH
jgi:putative ABC transport system permease protein